MIYLLMTKVSISVRSRRFYFLRLGKIKMMNLWLFLDHLPNYFGRFG